MKINKIILLTILITAFLASMPAGAKIGVGVGLGKIQIDEPLLPGGIYKLPTIPVLNTGDEEMVYEMDVTFQHEQPDLRPEKDWFEFKPQIFTLAGGGSQAVEVGLNLPLKITPGNYFAYLEAHPVATAQGGVTIGVAAATKTYFTVKPANIWQALMHKISSFLTTTSPTSYIILAVLIVIALIMIVQKYFTLNLNIAIRKKKTKAKEQEEEINNDQEN